MTHGSKPEVRRFSSDGVEIAFIDVPANPLDGATEQPIPALLIHGFASNIGTNWISTGWVRRFTEAGFRVVALDNRGHGQSEKIYDETAYPATVMAKDAVHLLDHLSIPTAHIIGYSMGARITAFISINNPERVTTATFGGMGINMVRGIGGARPIATALRAHSIDDIENPTARTFRAFAEATGSDLEALACCILSARDPITKEQLANLTVPLQVVVGDTDVVGGSATDLADMVPGARAVVLKGKDHMKSVGDRTFQSSTISFMQDHQ